MRWKVNMNVWVTTASQNDTIKISLLIYDVFSLNDIFNNIPNKILT